MNDLVTNTGKGRYVPPPVVASEIEVTLTLTLSAYRALKREVLGKGMMGGAWDAFKAADEDLRALGIRQTT